MKPNIHPKYVISNVSCACGASFITRSVRPVIKLDICSSCHPFFTGRQKLMDTAGRVEKFNKRFASTAGKMVARKPKAAKVSKTTTTKGKVLKTTPRPEAVAPEKTKKAKKAEKKAAA